MIDPYDFSITHEGPHSNDVRIIGVELAVRDMYGEEELEMFQCTHTIKNGGFVGPAWPRHKLRITIHTSHGDRTALIEL